MMKKALTFLLFILFGAICVFGQTPPGGYSSPASSSGGASSITGSPVSNGIFVTTGDTIWFQYTGLPASGVVFNTFRIQKSDGTIYDATQQGTAWSVTCTAGSVGGGTGTGLVLPVSGWLIGATGLITSAGSLQGQTYGNIYILGSMPSGGGTGSCTGNLSTGQIGTLLMGANIASNFPMAWTVGGGNLVVSPLDGMGFPASVAPSNPSAGADWTNTFSTGQTNTTTYRIAVQSVHFILTSSATVANRQVCLQWKNGATVIFQACANGVQTATQVVSYDFMPGIAPSGTAGLQFMVPLPAGFMLSSNNILASSTTGIQVGDQISNIQISLMEWNEND